MKHITTGARLPTVAQLPYLTKIESRLARAINHPNSGRNLRILTLRARDFTLRGGFMSYFEKVVADRRAFMEIIVTVAIVLVSGSALAQRVDLKEMADQVFHEVQERLRLQQQERLLDQQEAEYERQMCITAGYRGPDVEQCVLDSAAYHRGIGEAPLFVPDPPMPPPWLHCATVDLGRDTTCD
jgi:hypothetical protein